MGDALNFRRCLAMFLIIGLLSGSVIGCGNKTQADSTENSQTKESDATESASNEESLVETPSEGTSVGTSDETNEESMGDDISDDSDFVPITDLYCAIGGDILLTEDEANVTVNYGYDELILGENAASKYPELDKALKAYFETTAKKVKNAADEAQKFVTEVVLPGLSDDDYYESLPYRIDDDISVRRCDDQVFSFISDYEEWLPMEMGEYKVTGYNYNPDTGEEISFSDVVKDVDAFADILADRLIMDVEYPFYVGDVTNYHEPVKKSIVSFIEEGDISFTIDYQGVTVYFPAYTLLGWSTAGSVIFAEDENGTIFDQKWAAASKENWISYLPLGAKLGFDKEDDGTADVLGIYAPDIVNGEEVNVTFSLNGEEQIFEYDYSYNMEPIMVHCGGETYLLLRYCKFENGFMDVFRITDEGARKIDTGSFEFGDGTMVIEGEEYNIYPQRLYTYQKDFPMEIRTDMLSSGWAYGYFTFEKGKFVNKDVYLTIETSDDPDFVLTLLKDVKDAPIVDSASHEETGEKTDLTERQTLRLMYTDNETYVDCLTEDGILVRVYVTDDEGYTSAFGYDIDELFDGIVYSG